VNAERKLPPVEGYTRGRALHRRHLEHEEPREFELLGRRWTLLPGVFAPFSTPVTELFSGTPLRGRFLEMGCGAGVASVTAALAGCDTTALDIAASAVENTQLNARRHGVRLDVRQSDLFAALAPEETFDLIYFNTNFALPPADHLNLTDLDHAFFDPGYATHARFLGEAFTHATPGGRVLLGFSDLGSWPQLRAACRAAGLEPDIVRSRRCDGIEFQLVELYATSDRSSA
jgi:release factor glutamine methyltransferase